MNTMLTFVDTPVTYEAFLEEIERHYELDQIVQGHYFREGKGGCAVGCTLAKWDMEAAINGDHRAYEVQFGIPHIIAHLQDRIFEGLAQEDAREFPVQFAKAIRTGQDLSLVWPRFAHWLLVDPEHGVIQQANKQGVKVIQQVADLYQRWIDGNKPSIEEFENAIDAAYAAYAAAAVAYAAAAAVAYAAAAVADAAAAVAAVAYADAYAADGYAADAYAAAASLNHYQVMRDKLLELIQNAPIVERSA